MSPSLNLLLCFSVCEHHVKAERPTSSRPKRKEFQLLGCILIPLKTAMFRRRLERAPALNIDYNRSHQVVVVGFIFLSRDC